MDFIYNMHVTTATDSVFAYPATAFLHKPLFVHGTRSPRNRASAGRFRQQQPHARAKVCWRDPGMVVIVPMGLVGSTQRKRDEKHNSSDIRQKPCQTKL